MTRRLTAISAVIVLLSGYGLSAQAQSFGNSGSRGGGMGSSGFGSSGMGSSGFGSSGFGSSGFGNSGSGSSGFGNSGFGGGSGFGSSGFGGNSGFGNSGFGNSGGGQNFIGRDAGDMQATFGQMNQMNQMNRAGAQFFNNMNRSMNRNNRSNRKSSNQTAQKLAQPVRVDVKVAFTPPRQSSEQMVTAIRRRLAKILAGGHMSPATVTMEGGTAVISGVAASENERDVISQLLAIEPGIESVRNEMTIGGPAGAPSDTAPPAGS